MQPKHPLIRSARKDVIPRDAVRSVVRDIVRPVYGLETAVQEVQNITWLLPFNLNGTATIPTSGGDVTDGFADTTPRYPRVWDSTSGLVLSEVVGPAFISEGMRISYDVDEASLGDELWDDTPGTVGTGWTQDGSVYTGSNATGQFYDNVVSANRTAELSFDITSATSGSVRSSGLSFGSTSYSSIGSYSEIVTVGSGGNIGLDGENFNGTIDNVSVKEITPAFLNSVSKADSTKLHPSKVDATNGNEVMLQYDYWPGASQVVAAGTYAYVVGTDNHNYALYTAAGGTTGGSAPSVATADIGSTVTDNTVTWSVQSYYSNLATASQNYLPHVLNEPVGVNIALQSEDFSTTWSSTRASITPNSTAAPDGNTTADTLADDGLTGSASVFLSQTVTVANSTTYTYSVYAKQKNNSWVLLYGLGFTTPANGGVYFDLGNGVVGTESAGFSGDIRDEGNGWYRCSVTFTTDATDTLGSIQIYLADSDGDFTITRDGTHDIYIWGAQLETGSVPTNYIHTTTGSEQRDATDYTATATIDNYTYWRIEPNTQDATMWLSDGTNAFGYDGTNIYVTDGTNTASSAQTIAIGDIIGWDNTAGKLYYNGTLVDTDATVVCSWSTSVQIGSKNDNTLVTNGGVTDWYTTSADPDLTDISWSQP